MLATIFAVIFGVVMGLAFTFYGLRVFLVLLPVWAFFAGFWLGAYTITLVVGDTFVESLPSFFVGLVAGIVFAVLAYRHFGLGVALVTAAFGAALGTGVVQAIGLESDLLVALLGVAVALILVWVLYRYDKDRYLIIVITALGGASLIIAAGLLIFGRISLDQVFRAGNPVGPVLADSWLWAIAWLGLAVAGVYVQIKAHGDFDFRQHDLVQGWG